MMIKPEIHPSKHDDLITEELEGEIFTIKLTKKSESSPTSVNTYHCHVATLSKALDVWNPNLFYSIGTDCGFQSVNRSKRSIRPRVAMGYRQLFEELERDLCEITGYDQISFQFKIVLSPPSPFEKKTLILKTH